MTIKSLHLWLLIFIFLTKSNKWQPDFLSLKRSDDQTGLPNYRTSTIAYPSHNSFEISSVNFKFKPHRYIENIAILSM